MGALPSSLTILPNYPTSYHFEVYDFNMNLEDGTLRFLNKNIQFQPMIQNVFHEPLLYYKAPYARTVINTEILP